MTVQKRAVSKNISEEKITSKNLSIQFSLDGFSFSISNQHDEIYLLKEYSFRETVSIAVCLNKIVTTFKTEKELQSDFKNVSVIHQNYLNTLVPDSLFDTNELKSYLKFTVKILATDRIDSDSISKTRVKNVYIPYININNFLFQNFGPFEFKHHMTVLIEKLLLKNNGFRFYIHVSKHHVDIIVIEGISLIFANSFEYHSKEDFIYYILFVAEQLKLNPEKLKVILLGEIENESDLFSIVYKYIREVSFLKNDHFLLSNTPDFSRHSNFILLG
ncbi:MAG: DUF3822 family protein [Flavobacteriaceae bacterium]|nr:MAG: DUF3822 family protein [Flavobacteriaceae bacterium]